MVPRDDADDRSRLDAGREQVIGECVGVRIEFTEGELAVLVGDGSGLGILVGTVCHSRRTRTDDLGPLDRGQQLLGFRGIDQTRPPQHLERAERVLRRFDRRADCTGHRDHVHPTFRGWAASSLFSGWLRARRTLVTVVTSRATGAGYADHADRCPFHPNRLSHNSVHRISHSGHRSPSRWGRPNGDLVATGYQV